MGALGVRLSSGVFYMEVELLEMKPPCYPQFGFAGASFASSDDYQGQGVGDDAISWAVDGERGKRWHGEGQRLAGPKWKEGDVIGLAVNLGAGALYVSVNGVYPDGGPAFERGVVPGGAVGEWLYPALSAANMRVRCNLGAGGFKHAPPPAPPAPPLYPGEVGDRHCETTVMLLLTPPAAPVVVGATTASAAQLAAGKLTSTRLTELLAQPGSSVATTTGGPGAGDGGAAQPAVLASDEERARGAQALPQRECLEWEARSARVLGQPKEAIERDATDAEARHARAGTAVVGVVLPMAPARAKQRLQGVRAVVAQIVGLPDAEGGGEAGGAGVRVVRVSGRTTSYCAVPSVAELRRLLAERSNADLRAHAAAAWGVAPADGAARADVVAAVVDAFARRELRKELAAALRGALEGMGAAGLEAALGPLLAEWNAAVSPAAPLEERMAAAAAALGSAARWEEVAAWAGLFRVRMQGRTRLGLEELMAREGERIGKFGLTRGEVLALYLYTGPEFVPMNGILRSFPLSLLDLLAGNTLCTTLFCISSALKKVATGTELPRSGKVYRGLGKMSLPAQFWVPHGDPAWRGGVERAFMSTTAERLVALFYANGRGTVVEISVGRIQIGGDVKFISMVTHAPRYTAVTVTPYFLIVEFHLF